MKTKFNLNFIDNNGTFTLVDPDKFKRLYFPLMNETGFISSITPDLKGDIKTGQDSFLNIPVSVEDLYLTNACRNFWVKINNKDIWSASGVSREQNKSYDKTLLVAGLLYHKIIRENTLLKIKAEITNFVPASKDPVEIMIISLTNLSNQGMTLDTSFGMPLFCRSAENLRDHRNVTSMLNRIRLTKNGVLVKPTMLFNESSHKLNYNSYYVAGFTETGKAPIGFYPTVLDFAGESNDFEQPEAVYNNKPSVKNIEQGVEAIAGLKFNTIKLEPQKTIHFIILMGITQNEALILKWHLKFGGLKKSLKSLEDTKKYWLDYSERIKFEFADAKYNNWLKWVAVQPLMRKIAGNSFIPDFDYGKGGRGWRDLWQDLLALILVNPKNARNLLLNNFAGIRIDGSNATIIGKNPGEFIADRNNVARVWMDHGVWPFYTTKLYIDQSGDYNILFTLIKYFKDFQIKRAQEKDWNWKPEHGNILKTTAGKVYHGTVLEHILVQHLVQFFNIGDHNNIKLEDADWNDGLDMAPHKGESVAFTAFYAGNLLTLAELLGYLQNEKQIAKIDIFEEMMLLLDTMTTPINYYSITSKREIYNKYQEKVKHTISGKKIQIPIEKLIKDLRDKAEWIKAHIQENEWIKTRKGLQYFNGYYDNNGKKVEGDNLKGFRMTLTGQVFPIMFKMADETKTLKAINSILNVLWDKNLQGLRLNTNFNEVKLDFGRAFGFAYGNKENGAFFSHMNVMFANALYQNNYVKQGNIILNSIFNMWQNHDQSKIYPCTPEYYNNEGRGYYLYLTGSASWYILTLLHLVMGINGSYGDLVISPNFLLNQFNDKNEINCFTTFADKYIKVKFTNPNKKEFGKYTIKKVKINNKSIALNQLEETRVTIKRSKFLQFASKSLNSIEVELN